ncbi:hypothetical protein ES319_D09G041600v1 [Gossypium barbadense]|uniref:Uncharacterized protein n=1 Tax=Gossypium barbadense TaxID=3634 RepID=A0A5J5PYV4_GOSBA|nr:hypothetical protein ES319_D09G041600v1 [Gossypium barbadense]
MSKLNNSLQLQKYGTLSREQLSYLFDRFSLLIAQPDFKKRILDAVNDKQEPVAVTTAVQEEIFLEMGVDPSFGLACLGKVNMTYENDQDLMIRYYRFVANEELACDEAELGPEGFAEKLHSQQKLHEQLHHQMEDANFESEASILSAEQIQEIVRRRVSPLFRPS